MEQNNIDFKIVLNMSLAIENNKVNITIKNIDLNPAMITLSGERRIEESKTIQANHEKKTLHDIILETAKKLKFEMGKETFSASDLYKQASINYPEINRASFGANVISAAPEHNSWKHYPNKKELLTYLGKGKFKLK